MASYPRRALVRGLFFCENKMESKVLEKPLPAHMAQSQTFTINCPRHGVTFGERTQRSILTWVLCGRRGLQITLVVRGAWHVCRSPIRFEKRMISKRWMTMPLMVGSGNISVLFLYISRCCQGSFQGSFDCGDKAQGTMWAASFQAHITSMSRQDFVSIPASP
jgi:hypothetical protein